MKSIVCIVEGYGELQAVPVLLRRLAERLNVYDLLIPEPIRVHRDRFLNRADEFEKKVALAALKAQSQGLVLIVLDADDDCPVLLARLVATRAIPFLRGVNCQVVIANREYESWLLAAASSLASKRGLPPSMESPPNSEAIRDAKGWLSDRMVAHSGECYRPVVDQAALSAVVDVTAALKRSRSLQQLEKCISSFLLGCSSALDEQGQA
jgi:hypothetical protein